MRPRLVFMGTPEFGVPTLRHLARSGFPVAAVVTQPDKPRGRGHAEIPSPVKQAARELGLPVLQPDSVNTPEALAALTQAAPEVIVVAAFGQILKAPLLALPRWGCVNLHASLLPKYRGAAPVQWSIAQGETETGVTVQKMAERVDTGAVLVQRTLAVGPEETTAELAARLAELGAPAVAEALEQLAAADGHCGVPQDDARATLAPRLTREDGRLDWTLSGGELHDRVRGFNPWPGTYAMAHGRVLKVLVTHRSDSGAPPGTAPGAVLAADPDQGWLVAAGAGTTVWVTRVQCPSKSGMTAHAYACGYHFGVGDRLQ
jgi:methionyl-tRNA formyltransferase